MKDWRVFERMGDLEIADLVRYEFYASCDPKLDLPTCHDHSGQIAIITTFHIDHDMPEPAWHHFNVGLVFEDNTRFMACEHEVTKL